MLWNGLELPPAYYSDDAVYIINADCRDVLPLIPDKSIDLVLTDPPYKDDDVDSVYYLCLLGRFANLKFNDYVIFFNNSSRLYDLFKLLGRPYRILIWSKGVVKYAWRWEPILIYSSSNPSFKINKNIYSDHLPYQPLCKSQSHHKYEKPIKLLNTLVSFIPQDKIILDSFMGIGTTLVAAKKLGRKCIGIEIEEKYCRIAADRCRQMVFDLKV